MSSEALSGQIGMLVDNLRKQKSASLSLTEVASVTEVLIATTQMFFKTIDTSVYKEFLSLSDYITNARKEIASLQPGDLESTRIPRAGLELDAIVQQTEEATNTIMNAAEEIMGADTEDPAAYQATVNDAVMLIFEACSFQDITGQRITKVVETLAHIEQRVLELRNLLGVTEEDIEDAKAEAEPVSEDKALLSGPALEGEGIDQGEVDALMGSEGAAPAAQAPTAPAEKPAPAAKAEAKPAPKAKPKPAPEPKPEPKPEPPKAVDPKQLDNMFEEDFDPVADVEKKEKAKAEEKAKRAKAAEEAKKAETAEKAKDGKSDELPAGEEVSQDDIDALFG